MTPHDLSALVSSRICHDLISPIGAIANGVELMQDLGGGGSAELGLIGDSAEVAGAKLRYFRIAFGAAPADATVPLAELDLATRAMFSGRTRAVLAAAPDRVPRVTAKLLLLALLCVEKSLPQGGAMEVRLAPDGFGIAAEAERVRDRAGHWALLEGAEPAEPLAASDVQFVLLAQTVHATGAALARSFTETRARVTVEAVTP